MLSLPHMAPLVEYTARLREQDRGEVPEFDPLDGGVNAQILFVFEKPGPMTAEAGRRIGSGFISRNNDDPTAENTYRFMREARIPRAVTAIWNSVPWWNGTRKIGRSERKDGADEFESLCGRLPRLSAVVMVGKSAERLKPYLEGRPWKLFLSAHPSLLVRATFRTKWEAIPSEWAKVMSPASGSGGG